MPKLHTEILLEKERFELKPKSGGGLLNYEVWGYKKKGKTIVTSTPASRPFIPQPHLVNLRSPFGVGLEEPFDEVLELLAALEQVGVEAGVEVKE